MASRSAGPNLCQRKASTHVVRRLIRPNVGLSGQRGPKTGHDSALAAVREETYLILNKSFNDELSAPDDLLRRLEVLFSFWVVKPIRTTWAKHVQNPLPCVHCPSIAVLKHE